MVFFRIKHNKNKKKEDRYYAYICRTFRSEIDKNKVIHKEDLKLGRVSYPPSAAEITEKFPEYEQQIRDYFEKRSGRRQLEAAEKGLQEAKDNLQEGMKSLKD